MSAPLPLSAQSARTTVSPITYFIQKALETQGLVSFAPPGWWTRSRCLPGKSPPPSMRSWPTQPLRRPRCNTAPRKGCRRVREKLLHHVCKADGVKPVELALTADDIVLTTGSQQLLYLLGEAVLDEGDIVITEVPSYFVYHSLLQSHGIRVLTVPMDPGGMDMNALESLLAVDRAASCRGSS